jgi:hypothetical protein
VGKRFNLERLPARFEDDRVGEPPVSSGPTRGRRFVGGLDTLTAMLADNARAVNGGVGGASTPSDPLRDPSGEPIRA